MFNEPISPPSSTPSSPPYYTISFDSEPSDPQSPTLAQLQTRALSTHNQPEPETNIPLPPEQPLTPQSEPHNETPSENPITHNCEPPIETTPSPPAPTSPIPEPEPTFPTLEEEITLFAESSVEKISSLSENSGISDDPSADAAEAAPVAAEAEAKAKANAEQVAHIAAKEAAKAKNDALTQGEQSHSNFTPLVLKTLEELQKEQQIVRAILDQQDSVNNNIQNLLTHLLTRMPPPPNP
ncbi:uncharacterized protein LOC127081101 [Lathyrus oleraceus]|uniref:uncharacterized protein LOC127081101 n=1 Tax=Pisum sativum TaxID=3888 RepID=UPI0021D21BF7|nr:uncharacterized protein LOC127081101 [Pisum sativum]